MGRIHLFEIEDQGWCPKLVREAITDFLLGLYNLLYLYEPAFQKINALLTTLNINAVVDCCSGSGGPIKQLREYLDKVDKQSITITITDKYPNIKSFQQLESLYGNRLVGQREPIDATELPTSLQGLRTFFSAFHHFAPKKALKILQDAVDNDAPIAIFESTRRHLTDFIRALLSPLLAWVFIPFAGRLTLAKFFWTYLLPIMPFMIMWDYIVSNFRTYSLKEMYHLIDQLEAPGYTWEVGKLWSKKAKCHIPFLVGYRVKSQQCP
jgi:hypothetical protein